MFGYPVWFLVMVLSAPAAGVSGVLPAGKQQYVTPAEQTAAFNKCGSVCQLGK